MKTMSKKIQFSKIIFILLFIIIFPLIVTTQSKAIEPNNKNKSIILGGDNNFPPRTFLEDGKPAGYIVDVTKAVAKAVSLDVQIQFMPWQTSLNKLGTGDLDVVAMSYSDKRAQTYEFSVQFALNAFGLMVKSNSKIKNITDLQGHNILVQKGGVMRDYIEIHPINANLTYMDDVGTILQELNKKNVDGAFLSKKTGYFIAKKLGISDLEFTTEDINPRKTVFAVTKGNYQLIQYLNEGLSIINSNGKLKDINEKWFGPMKGNTIDFGTIKIWTARFATLIFIILLIGFFWNRHLKAEIDRRKIIEQALRESEQRYRTIFNNSPMGIYVYRLESDGRLILESVNHSADKLTNINNKELIGKTIEEAFPALKNTEVPDAYRLAASKGEIWKTEDIAYKDGLIQGAFDVQAFQSLPGRVTVIFSNITKKKRIEAEKEKLIQSLQDALEEVKQLSGMLPICSSCKKIRDDNGYWNQVEAYITRHSEAVFSHGICPDCIKQLYPNITISKK